MSFKVYSISWAGEVKYIGITQHNLKAAKKQQLNDARPTSKHHSKLQLAIRELVAEYGREYVKHHLSFELLQEVEHKTTAYKLRLEAMLEHRTEEVGWQSSSLRGTSSRTLLERYQIAEDYYSTELSPEEIVRKYGIESVRKLQSMLQASTFQGWRDQHGVAELRHPTKQWVEGRINKSKYDREQVFQWYFVEGKHVPQIHRLTGIPGTSIDSMLRSNYAKEWCKQQGVEHAFHSAPKVFTPAARAARAKIAAANKGEKHHFYGKTHTPETKAKISAALLGVYKGEKHHFYGKTHTPETKAKISAAKTKIGAASKGRRRGYE